MLKIKDLKDLQAVLDVMRQNNLAALEIEEDGQQVRLRMMEPQAERVVYAAPEGIPAAAPAAPAAPAPASAAPAAPPVDEAELVPSPLVGTFYRSPSPEADPFVQEGDRVEDDTVIGIVEAMKVMNEIRAGRSGVVREILASNGDPVEFGQPMFRISPS
ncbi:MAG: acetyl-CoA carboxylase biotin carboxyl carrier protein [Planctomycetota bacterium]